MRSYTVNVHDDGVIDYEAPNGQEPGGEPDKVTARLQLPADLYDVVEAEIKYEVSARAAAVARRADYCDTYDLLARESGLLDREQVKAARAARAGLPEEPRVGSVIHLSVTPHRTNGRIWERVRSGGWRTFGSTSRVDWYDLVFNESTGKVREFELVYEPKPSDRAGTLRRFDADSPNPARDDSRLILKSTRDGWYYYSDVDHDWSACRSLDDARARRDEGRSAHTGWPTLADEYGPLIEVPEDMDEDEANALT